MKLNKEIISKLNPCKDRFHNYLKFYENKEHSKAQFMGLKNISQSDKLWVAFRLMSKENAVLAAADIAESVLEVFETQYPNDKRPRLAIEAARYKSSNAAAHAAHAAHAAYAAGYAASYVADAACVASYAATSNAAYAAANAAHAAADAACVASYAATSNAAYAAHAAYAAANAAHAAANEKLIRKIVLRHWKG